MRLLIDGDGSPVKNEVIALGATYHLPVMIVTSVDHYTKKEFPAHVQFIYVDKGSDRADYEIVKEIKAGDFLVTQDYGLASLVLPKHARVFHHNGIVSKRSLKQRSKKHRTNKDRNTAHEKQCLPVFNFVFENDHKNIYRPIRYRR